MLDNLLPLPDAWQPALQLSRFFRQLLTRDPALLEWLHESADRPVDIALMQAYVEAKNPQTEEDLKRVLRGLRARILAKLAIHDLALHAPLADIVEGMTQLADFTVNLAHDFLHRQLTETYGDVVDSEGRIQRMAIIGMGKLGGRELNVSSDIDLIFIYPEDGRTTGRKQQDAYEFFFRLGKKIIAMLNDVTEDGQVFRVDMRLRPNGDSGPLVCSRDALENYFITQGREWERYAWIKARVLNAEDPLARAVDIVQTARPFVFRKYLDFGAINAMRDLHVQIRREVARKEMADHIKLGPGGIREIEFIAQVFQLIRGGRDIDLQIKPTLSVLKRIAERQLIPEGAEGELAAAYDFLRRLEHRLQFMDDAQTHRLPSTPEDRALIAESMNFPDWDTLLVTLDGHRTRVSRHFEAVFSEPETEEESGHVSRTCWSEGLCADDLRPTLESLGYNAPEEVAVQLVRFRESTRYQQLPQANRERVDCVIPRLIEQAATSRDANLALTRTLAFLETIARRGAYLALLQQYPQALKKLIELLGASAWAAEYLTRHPILLDELLSPALLEGVTCGDDFRRTLDAKLASAEGDTEREMDLLREEHHAQVFRLLALDLSGRLSIEHLSDHLTELADTLLTRTINLCWSKLKNRHCETPRFAAIGYGKLGGKELGYASDLDLVFIYDDDHPSAQENYTRLAQRINTWLSSQTPAGILFETDLRLRPNGESGLLAVNLESFTEYQQQKAWIWEHQALTRARFVCGDAALGARFETLREHILRKSRDQDELRREVLAMRQKMLDNHASGSSTEMDLKQDRGGIIDVEFIVQYLVLRHAANHPQLTGNLGNIALLRIAGELGLIPEKLAGQVGDAYREFRRLQHLKRLNNTPKGRVSIESIQKETDAVKTLWSDVFDSQA